MHILLTHFATLHPAACIRGSTHSLAGCVLPPLQHLSRSLRLWFFFPLYPHSHLHYNCCTKQNRARLLIRATAAPPPPRPGPRPLRRCPTVTLSVTSPRMGGRGGTAVPKTSCPRPTALPAERSSGRAPVSFSLFPLPFPMSCPLSPISRPKDEALCNFPLCNFLPSAVRISDWIGICPLSPGAPLFPSGPGASVTRIRIGI